MLVRLLGNSQVFVLFGSGAFDRCRKVVPAGGLLPRRAGPGGGPGELPVSALSARSGGPTVLPESSGFDRQQPGKLGSSFGADPRK